jgi:hypothetical protein
MNTAIPGVPHLSSHDLRVDLQEAYRAKRHHHLFAFFGTGDEGVLAVDGADVTVVPVRSELELRERLPALTTNGEQRIAFLVPWTHDIPLDIAGRFALNGRVRRIGKDARLRAMLGVAEVDEDARRSPLADYLLRPGNGTRYPVSEARLSLDGLWSVWLRVDWGVETEGGLALDTLLAFVAFDPRGPQFAEAMRDVAAGGTRDALLAWLGDTLGAAAPAAWRMWEQGQGRRVMQLALVCEPLARSPLADVRMWLRREVADALKMKRDANADINAAIDSLAREAPGAMRVLERRQKTSELRLLAREADDLVVEPDVRAELVESARLPSSWTMRLARLGTALKDGAQVLTVNSANDASRALRALDGHAFFKDADEGDRLRRAEMAVRLLCWLVARPDKRIVPGNTPYGEAEAFGRWYAQEGGYVDRARRAARGSAEDAFGKGVQAVVVKADETRTVMDRAFAHSLSAWVDAGQPSTQVIPIHDAVKRVAVRFLEGNEQRRLLVLLLDGMAWAQAGELLESLGSRAAPWGPLAWHSAKENRIGETSIPVVFAAIPTVTEVSRSSFFAGKGFGPGAKLTTSDPDHWALHAGVKKLVPPTDIPRLLLRGEGHTKAGGASPEALSLVADPERRVVALVLNAIDDSLKASHAVRHPWGVANIASLAELLEKARQSGRSVLLASDHGHVPADRIQRQTPDTPQNGARWRAWTSPTAPVADNEVGFSGPRVYTPPGAHGVVLLADDASAYVGNAHNGEHGGATLAEVVAPCLLIGCADNLDPTRNDPGLEAQAIPIPRWWYFEVDEGEVVVDVAPPPPKKPLKPSPQLDLPTVAPIIAAPPAPLPPEPKVPASAFVTSAVLKARVKDAAELKSVAEAVDQLLSRQCVMADDAFAAAMRLLPFRVGGFISKLREALNIDGYEVIRYDPTARQVHLDRDKLAQLFEVTL